jgi:hypothetical protein
MPKPKIILVDGHSLAYRAFFALPPDLKTRSGELTNAVYGFASMLLAVWRDEKPDYIAVAFDVGKTFRDEMYAEYKATRAKMPDELAPQLDRAKQQVDFVAKDYQAKIDDYLNEPENARRLFEREYNRAVVVPQIIAKLGNIVGLPAGLFRLHHDGA